jgi:outer membrane receptor protein involved in Fe transport
LRSLGGGKRVENRTVFDLAAHYDLYEDARLFFSVENLFDNKYAVARQPSQAVFRSASKTSTDLKSLEKGRTRVSGLFYAVNCGLAAVKRWPFYSNIDSLNPSKP